MSHWIFEEGDIMERLTGMAHVRVIKKRAQCEE